jgi:hypothetical protein
MTYPESDARKSHEHPAWLKRACGGAADGGQISGPEKMSDAGADTSPMAVEEKGRALPMSMNQAMGSQQGSSQQAGPMSSHLNNMTNQMNKPDTD